MQNAALPEYTDIPACLHFAALLLLTHVIYHVGWTHMRPCFTQISIPTYHMGCRVTVLIVVAEWIRWCILNKYTEYWPIWKTAKKYEVVSLFFHYFSDFPGFSNKIHLFLQKYTQKIVVILRLNLLLSGESVLNLRSTKSGDVRTQNCWFKKTRNTFFPTKPAFITIRFNRSRVGTVPISLNPPVLRFSKSNYPVPGSGFGS